MDTKKEATENMPDYFAGIYPELMTAETLRARISEHGVEVGGCDHPQLCVLYYKHLSSLPRRTPHPNRRGRRTLMKIKKEERFKIVETRNLGFFKDSKRAIFQASSSATPEMDKLAARSKAVAAKRKGAESGSFSEFHKLQARNKAAVAKQADKQDVVSHLDRLEARSKAAKEKLEMKFENTTKDGGANKNDDNPTSELTCKKRKVAPQRKPLEKRLNGSSDTSDGLVSPTTKPKLNSNRSELHKPHTVQSSDNQKQQKINKKNWTVSDEISNCSSSPIKKAKLTSGVPGSNALNEPKKPGGTKRLKLKRKSLASFSDG